MLRTPRHRRALAIALLMSACGTNGSGQAGQPSGKQLVPYRSLAIPNADELGGGGSTDLIGLYSLDTSNGFRSTLHLYRHDLTVPDELVDLGATYLGVDTLYQRFADVAFGADRVAVSINDNLAPASWVSVVSLAGGVPSLIATVPLDTTIDRAVASGSSLLVAIGSGLRLLDLTTPGSPVVLGTYGAASPVTSLVGLGGAGYLAFTTSGYVKVRTDLSPPTFVEAADSTMRNFAKLYPDASGTRALAAGPSIYAGKSRVAWLDLGGWPPPAPVSTSSADVEGAFVDCAYDGVDAVVLETGSPGLGGDAYLVRSAAGAFTSSKVGAPGLSFHAQSLAAHGGRLYSAAEGLLFFRIP